MILAIDLGSTSFKAGVFDAALRQLGRGEARLSYDFGADGKVELKPADIEQAFQTVIREALKSAAPDTLRAVAIASQAQTFTVLDDKGEPKLPFISWQDQRGTCRDIRLADFERHCSFRECLPGQQLAQLIRLQETCPGLISPSESILHLPTVFVRRLCGKAVMDENLAAMSGLYSLPLRDWWPAALQLCGISARQLPSVIPVGTSAGDTTAAAATYGLPAGIPIILAGNDQTAGAYGARLHETNGVLVTLGTAHVIYTCEIAPPEPGSTLVRGPYPGRLHYRMDADDCGGSVVNWARALLCADASDDAFFALAEKADAGCQGLVFDAELPRSQGAWTQLNLHHSRAALARSVLEALVRRLAKQAERLRVTLTPGSVFVAGGGSRQPLWVRLLSDALRCPLAVTDASPLTGAARMAHCFLSDK